MTVTIIPRTEWGARSARHRNTIRTPTPELWLHHTAGNHVGTSGMRAIQNFHMDGRGWSDIAYSYVIDRVNHRIYEARGAGIAGGHTKGHNRVSHAVCVMGNMSQFRPTNELLELIAQLVAHGHRQGWWPNQLTGGHRDVANTECPGNHLYARIPDINTRTTQILEGTTMADPLAQRIQTAAQSVGYSAPVTGELVEQNALDVEHMAKGIRNLIDDNNRLDRDLEEARRITAGLRSDITQLGATIAELEQQLTQSEADQDLAAAVRALIAAEANQ